MKLATFTASGRTSYGAVANGGVIDLGRRLKHASLTDVLRAGALGEAEKAAAAQPDIALKDVVLLPPLPSPEKILCIGVNYANRNAEYKDGSEQAKYPSMFFRNPGSFTGHDQPLIRPPESAAARLRGRDRADHRPGRAAHRRKSARWITSRATRCATRAPSATGRATPSSTSRRARTSTRPGASVRISSPPTRSMRGKPLHLTTTVNGETRQDDTTANLIFTFADLIAYVTTFMTLRAGDILVTGTPVGAGARFDPPRWLKPGDVVEIAVPEIGVLRNGVADES